MAHIQHPSFSFAELARSAGREPPSSTERPVVCVQGLGFVGLAMAVAVASARDASGRPCFDVIGLDLPTEEGKRKVAAVNAGHLSLASTDASFGDSLSQAHREGNLLASTDPACYRLADVTVVDVHLDVAMSEDGQPEVDFAGFRRAIATLGAHMRPGSLVLVETTVPPGTCEKVVAPVLAEALAARGLPPDALLLAHSYERVMPGGEYLDSIRNFWRVYAGHTDEAANACEQFLARVINIADYPMVRLASTTASEIGKVLENSYRATNIAFIEEWGRFAEATGVDLFEVIDAIRIRPTHSNIRQPGFGVGGYCLTKDPLFGPYAARNLFSRADLEFPFSTRAVETNRRMPLGVLDRLSTHLHGLNGKSLLLLGVSYRQDVGDTRHSPAESFVREAERRGARVTCHDPLVDYWPELDRTLSREPPSPKVDAVVFAVAHEAYRGMDLPSWLAGHRPLVFDANRVLSEAQLRALEALDVPTISVGRGASDA